MGVLEVAPLRHPRPKATNHSFYRFIPNHLMSAYDPREGKRGLLTTAPGLAVYRAPLPALRGVYSKQANPLVSDLNGVAVDDPWACR